MGEKGRCATSWLRVLVRLTPTTSGSVTAKERRRSPTQRGRTRSVGLSRLVGYLVVLGLGALATAGLIRTQNQADQTLRDRLAARSALSAEFVATFASQLLERENRVASRNLSNALDQRLTQVLDAFGFEAAIVLDAEGRLLAAEPPAVAMLGRPIGNEYAHLRAAVEGQRAVSNVVPSATKGVPVVAFATPYDTPHGRRVLSGSYAVATTPLHDYLKGISSLRGFQAFIIDEHGAVVAASGSARSSVLLADREPLIAGALKRGQTRDASSRFVAHSAVAGTPWRLVTAVPEASLLAPTHRRNAWQWAGLFMLIVTALFAVWLSLRLRDERRELRVANARLDAFAHRDSLTGLHSRRRLDQLLTREHHRAREQQSALSILLIDIDHFKLVNDTFGHGAGDDVLRTVAERIRGCARDDDSVGRWGGEEFLVLLHSPLLPRQPPWQSVFGAPSATHQSRPAPAVRNSPSPSASAATATRSSSRPR